MSNLCSCGSREPCRVHVDCACGCPRYHHVNMVGECNTVPGPTRPICHGCPEYRPAKMKKFNELDDHEIAAIGPEDMWRIKEHYRELRAHHIEETTALYRRAMGPAGPGRIKDNPRLDKDGDGQRFYQFMLHARGLEHDVICGACEGYGTRLYSNTSTWRGGMGGAAMTTGICDHCWGSGSAERPWTDLRDISERNGQMVAEQAVTAIAHSVGATFDSTKTSVREIIDHLDAMTRKRKVDFWTRPLAIGLANILRRAVGDPEKKER